MINFKGNFDDHQPMIDFLTIVIMLVFKWLIMNLFMGGYADLLLNGLKFVKQG